MGLVLIVSSISIWWHRPPQVPADFIHQPRKIPQSGAARLVLGKKISLNQANVDDFLILPGIGAERAAAIVRWREAHGPFARIEQLKNVPGLGSELFQRLSALVEVTPAHK